LVVLPSWSPGASSGSLEVTDTRLSATSGSTLSTASPVAQTFQYWWFGGQSRVGVTPSVSVGGVASAHSRASWGRDRSPGPRTPS
jgi:hypothetical protein